MSYKNRLKQIKYALRFLPDKMYIQIYYFLKFKNFINFKNPKSFNEKLNWLKLYDRNPRYISMVDKYEAKKYVSNLISGDYIIPTLGIWNSFDEIDFDSLPNQFVLKCTHDSGSFVICRNKDTFDKMEAKRRLQTSLNTNFYWIGREWPYKNIQPRIIAEQYMEDGLYDYKLLGLHDSDRMILVCSEIFSEVGIKEVFFDEVWNAFDVNREDYKNGVFPIHRNKQHKLIKKLAFQISDRISFSRIDFYEINKQTYYGEIMFNSYYEVERFESYKWNLEVDECIRITKDINKFIINDISFIIKIKKREENVANPIVDYKFFCFNGEVDSVMVCTERSIDNAKFYFFDKEWNLKKYNIIGEEASVDFTLPKPYCIDEMFDIAEKLSMELPYVRVDLYCIDRLIYFGEMTLYPASGFDTDILPEADEYWGKMLILPDK